MRLSHSKICTINIVLVNVVLIFLFWKFYAISDAYKSQTDSRVPANKQIDHIQTTNKHIKKTVTIVIRDFYDFENDLQRSIDSILGLIPTVQIIVIYNVEPYPPIPFMANYSALYSNVKFIDLSFDVKKTSKSLAPVFVIKTKYTLLLPDSVRLGGRSIIQKMLKEIENTAGLADGVRKIDATTNKSINRKIVVTPFTSNQKTMGNCCSIRNDYVNWTMEFSVTNDSKNCDMVQAIASLIRSTDPITSLSNVFFFVRLFFVRQFLQKHAILVHTSFLKMMPDPLAMPFPEMFYIQAKMAKSVVSRFWCALKWRKYK